MKLRHTAWALLFLGIVHLSGVASRETLPAGVGVCPAFAQEGWKGEFDSVCGQTDVAMALSEDELSDRIARCDRLKAKIEREDESTRKVYLRRLQMCRDLYHYVLQSKRPH